MSMVRRADVNVKIISHDIYHLSKEDKLLLLDTYDRDIIGAIKQAILDTRADRYRVLVFNISQCTFTARFIAKDIHKDDVVICGFKSWQPHTCDYNIRNEDTTGLMLESVLQRFHNDADKYYRFITNARTLLLDELYTLSGRKDLYGEGDL